MTTTPDIVVRSAEAPDFASWSALWQSYLSFCGATLSDEVTDLTWQRILDPENPVMARVADVDGTLAGFAVLVLHAGTWTKHPICYLEDLFVAERCRGNGVGRRLLDDIVRLANDNGWSRLYWHTKSDNAAARRLYDRFVEADSLVRYRMVFDRDHM